MNEDALKKFSESEGSRQVSDSLKRKIFGEVRLPSPGKRFMEKP
jgi:hypothetical protein